MRGRIWWGWLICTVFRPSYFRRLYVVTPSVWNEEWNIMFFLEPGCYGTDVAKQWHCLNCCSYMWPWWFQNTWVWMMATLYQHVCHFRNWCSTQGLETCFCESLYLSDFMTNPHSLHKAGDKIQHRCFAMVPQQVFNYYPSPWADPWNNGGYFVPQQAAPLSPEAAAAAYQYHAQMMAQNAQMQLAACQQASGGQPYPAEDVFGWHLCEIPRWFNQNEGFPKKIHGKAFISFVTSLEKNHEIRWLYKLDFPRLMSGMASPATHVAQHVLPKKETGREGTTTKRRHGMNGNLVAILAWWCDLYWKPLCKVNLLETVVKGSMASHSH